MTKRSLPILAGAILLLSGAIAWWSLAARRAGSRLPEGAVADSAGPALLPPSARGRDPGFAPVTAGGDDGAGGATRLDGAVVDALTGAAVGGAEVTFSQAGAAASARTGPDGRFRFVPPALGAWTLAAATARGYFPFAPEWGHSPVTFDALPGRAAAVTIRLAPTEPLEGRVLAPDGQPVAGAEIRLLGVHVEAALVPIPDRFTSGADGRFAFAAPEGTVVEARAPGLLPGRADVDFMALARGTVAIQLQEAAHELPAGAPIGGRVVGPNGQPVAGALVTGARELGFGVSDATAAAAVTGADGRFRLDDLGPGWWRVTARAADRAPASARRVAPGTADLVLTLADGGRLRGCVTDAASGGPVTAFTVHLLDVRSALRVASRESRAVIDASGCYALSGLQPGRARVAVSAPGYAPSAGSDVEIPEPGRGDATADARLAPGGRLTGVVLSDAGGRPIEGARVALEGQLESASSALPALAEAVTDVAGRFALAGLPRRASILVAAAGHHARIVGGIEAGPGGEAGPITVTLRAAAPDEEPRVDLAGIGVSLAPHGDGLTITGVVGGGGAERAGLARGDEILGIDGQPVVQLGMGDAVEAIRGPEGTVVTLTVRREGRTGTIQVTRTLVRG